MVLATVVDSGQQTGELVTATGVSLGTTLAVVCSWQRNRSIIWAILAGLLSWLYVLYFAITRKSDEVKH